MRSGIAQRVQPALLALGHDFIQRRHCVPCANFAGIDLVVVEILTLQGAVFIAQQSVFADLGGVEFHLQFHILCDHGQGRAELLHQHLARFTQVVDVGVVAIARVGQLFHQVFVVVIHTEAKGGQGHAAFALGHRHLLEAVEVADAHVEVTVGGQQDAVDTLVDKTFAGHLVGQFDAGRACGGATGGELVDGVADLGFFSARGGLEHHAGFTGVHHQ